MKKFNSLFTVFFLFVLGCKEYPHVEIIPDYESIYLSGNRLDTKPGFNEKSKKVSDKFWKIISENHKENKHNVYYFFDTYLYLNENGKVEKIKFQKTEPGAKYRDSLVNPSFNSLKKNLAKYFAEINFSPGILDGKKVKSKMYLPGKYKVDMKGNAGFILPLENNLEGFFNNSVIINDNYFVTVDEMPAIVGGIKELADKIVYPEQAKAAGIEGRVFVKAFIDENGDVVYTEIVKGLGYGCDEVALNAVKNTKFTPGKEKGKKVKTQVIIPISFKLQ